MLVGLSPLSYAPAAAPSRAASRATVSMATNVGMDNFAKIAEGHTERVADTGICALHLRLEPRQADEASASFLTVALLGGQRTTLPSRGRVRRSRRRPV